MQRIVIIGAGGHGQVVADILLSMAESGARIQPIGYLDDSPHRQGGYALGLPILGPFARLRDHPHDAVIVAVGDNAARRRIAEHLHAAGETLATAIHPQAIIARDVTIGPGSMICAGAIINPGTRIGACVILNTRSSVDHHSRIGDYAHLAPGVQTGGEVVVETGGFLGVGVSVMPRLRIGAWSVVGAAALVQRDIPPGVVAYGVPAQIRRTAAPPELD